MIAPGDNRPSLPTQPVDHSRQAPYPMLLRRANRIHGVAGQQISGDSVLLSTSFEEVKLLLGRGHEASSLQPGRD